MQAIPGLDRMMLESDAEFKDNIKTLIGNIVEYSQAPLRLRNICRHGYSCSGRCVTMWNF
jgi:hypothetical protein